jgi:hypothetical protein
MSWDVNKTLEIELKTKHCACFLKLTLSSMDKANYIISMISLRPLGHWDRVTALISFKFYFNFVIFVIFSKNLLMFSLYRLRRHKRHCIVGITCFLTLKLD